MERGDRRVAVVTGAAQGLGRAIALRLAADGLDLALCDRQADALEATAGEAADSSVEVHTSVLDVRDREAVADFLGEVGDAFGRVDVLVNNAGGGFACDFLDVSSGGEDALVHENFTSVTSCIRAATPLMPDGGSIVNITSIEGHRAAPGYAIYAAMKAAVANLTMSLALELSGRRIRVNCVAPDMIPTPGIGPLDASTPLPVEGRPDDVAAAVAFLAGEQARFVTGTTLHVDGGTRAAGGWHRDDAGGFRT